MAKPVKMKVAQLKELNLHLKEQFLNYENMRQGFDDEIVEEVDLYNDIDKNMQPWDKNTKVGREWWEAKGTVPYGYTIVQTMVARLIQAFFGKQNYLKVYVEDENYKDIEEPIQQWLQYEMDRIKLKTRARDFLEDSLVQRTTWLQLRPVMKGSKMTMVDFNVYTWFDVWFDTKVVDTEDTEFFIRNIVKHWKLKQDEKNYINLKKICDTMPPDLEDNKRNVYEAKHSKDKNITYYDNDVVTTDKEVEIMYWYGWWNVSQDPKKPDFKHLCVHWANREVIIRVENDDIGTKKKNLIFPIRPIRQANTLVGKSVMQIVKSLQYKLNGTYADTLQNFDLLTGLMFKYNKDSDIDLDELWAGKGNAIGVQDMKDVDLFNIPNNIQNGMAMISWIIQFMQQATGAVDYLMGTSSARGTTETASGIKTITEQAMFKFHMMAENVYTDLLEFVNFVQILWITYNPEEVVRKFPQLYEYVNQTAEQLEGSRSIDIGLNDLTLRRDVERTGFINGSNIIMGMLEKVNANIPEFVKQFLKKLEVPNVKKILEGAQSSQQGAEGIAAAMAAAKAGGNKGEPSAPNAATPEEEASNNTPKKPETGGA